MVTAFACIDAPTGTQSVDQTVAAYQATALVGLPSGLQKDDYYRKQRKMLRDMAQDLRRRRSTWIGKKSERNVARVCSGLIALYAKHYQTGYAGQATLSEVQRMTFAEQKVRSVGKCATAAAQPMSIFATPAAILAAQGGGDYMPGEDDPEATRIVDSIATPAWKDSVERAVAAEVEAREFDALYQSFGGDGGGGGDDCGGYGQPECEDEMSVFLPSRGSTTRTAFALGCIEGAKNSWALALRYYRYAVFIGGGPVGAGATAIGLVAGSCLMEGGIAALVAYSLWEE
jgi:hypothetical protein